MSLSIAIDSTGKEERQQEQLTGTGAGGNGNPRGGDRGGSYSPGDCADSFDGGQDLGDSSGDGAGELSFLYRRVPSR